MIISQLKEEKFPEQHFNKQILLFQETNGLQFNGK